MSSEEATLLPQCSTETGPESEVDTLTTMNSFSFDRPPRARSSTIGEVFGHLDPISASIQTRKLSLLTKNSGHKTDDDSSCCSGQSSPGNLSTSRRHHSERRMSWRQAIFTRVVTAGAPYESRHGSITEAVDSETEQKDVFDQHQPQTSTCNGAFSSLDSCRSSLDCSEPGVPSASYSSEYYRGVWKKAILEQVMAVKQDKAKTNERYEPVKHGDLLELRLVYTESPECQSEECVQMWKELLQCKCSELSSGELSAAVSKGVPRVLRSDVWKLLVSVSRGRLGRDAEEIPRYTYDGFREVVSPYQHTILIDLNRTFPHHPYFAQSCGAGQLSLFNLLKAYSILDTDVGYCQGLSFIVGLLLLHFDEPEAFDMLVHLMYAVGFRKQYRPDMLSLRVEMYQLSRLIHDQHKDLYDHFEQHDVPSVFAAPWFLTAFASTFPIGFVTRVLDFVFLSSNFDILFKVALVLLGGHKELIKNCDSFETINEFIKSTLPCMSLIQTEKVFQEVVELNLQRELLCYEVEYSVIQEDLLSSESANAESPTTATAGNGNNNNSKAFEDLVQENDRLKCANVRLQRENSDLMRRLQRSEESSAEVEQRRKELEEKLHSAETTISSIQCKVISLESRIGTLELERRSLLHSIAGQTSDGNT